MNSKLVLAIIAGVVVAGGLIAIRNLTSTEDTVEIVDARDRDSESDGGTTVRSTGDSASISTMDDSQSRTRGDRAQAGRTFPRGEGAVDLMVQRRQDGRIVEQLAIEDGRGIVLLAPESVAQHHPSAETPPHGADAAGLADDQLQRMPLLVADLAPRQELADQVGWAAITGPSIAGEVAVRHDTAVAFCGGDADLLATSLRRLATLDDAVVLYPGHRYSIASHATMGAVKETNPVLA